LKNIITIVSFCQKENRQTISRYMTDERFGNMGILGAEEKYQQ
jgi:hypothetical protein